MIKIVDQNRYSVVSYVVSREEEIENLPKDGLIGQGSTAFIIETSAFYMYDEEANEWKEI